MSQDLQSVLEAACRLPLTEQRRLAEAILNRLQRVAAPPSASGAGDEEITCRLNEVYAQEESTLDPLLMRMQVLMLEQEDW